MKVILTQDVRGQGKKGQLIDAAEGYARNFLLPRKLAVLATADAINTMNLKEKARRAEEAANRQAAVEMGGKLKNVTVKLTAKGGKEGKLFGAITSKEISEGLASQFQLDVPKQKIVLDEPIKAFGTYEVKAKLGYEVSARVLRQRERGVRRKITQLRRSSRGRYLLPADASFARGRAVGARLDAHRRKLRQGRDGAAPSR